MTAAPCRANWRFGVEFIRRFYAISAQLAFSLAWVACLAERSGLARIAGKAPKPDDSKFGRQFRLTVETPSLPGFGSRPQAADETAFFSRPYARIIVPANLAATLPSQSAAFLIDPFRELNMSHTQDENNSSGMADCAMAMQRLVDDHASGLIFAADIARIAESGNDDEVAAAMKRVSEYLSGELEHHFQHEEQTILGELLRNHPEYAALCIAIGKEHGHMRFMLVETSGAGPRKDLALFAQMLKKHTLLENEGLFPVVEKLFSPEQMREIANFSPRRPQQIPGRQPPVNHPEDAAGRQKWWADVVEFAKRPGQKGGRIVLLPQYNPELIEEMAQQTGLALFDFQREVMSGYGRNADSIKLDVLDKSLRSRAEHGGIISHNVEALLCVKSKPERCAWLQAFLDADWPNTVLLPISIYQPDVPSTRPAQLLHYP